MPETVSTVRAREVALQVNPFVSNRYHFGMLLGVDDLETEQAYHRGKTWLHHAWMHGSGVVWGLDVELRADDGVVVVHPGFAVDGHGRELVVASEMCLDLPAWFTERRPPGLEVVDEDDDVVSFDVQVELCHDTCLDRPVPSISEPCEGAALDTAYSRTVERGWPRLVPPRPEPPDPYPLLRQLLGQAPATDPLVADALADLADADPGDAPSTFLDWSRRVAAADVTALRPQEGAPGWSPYAGDGCVLLADLHAVLRTAGGTTEVVPDDEDAEAEGTWVDVLVRPALVRTLTAQELHRFVTEDDGAGDSLRAVAGSATLADDVVTLTFTRGPVLATLVIGAFAVAFLGDDGWTEVAVQQVESVDDGVTVTLTLASAPTSLPLRVVASGTGSTPILAPDGSPLRGVTGDPVVPSGSDAALMITGA